MKSRTDDSRFRAYWNDLGEEARKPYYVTSADDPRLIRWLREETNLERCFLAALEFAAEELRWPGGDVLDVGAGVCWTTALLSKRAGVASVLAIDFSRHRIEQIAPLVIAQLQGNIDKITRVCGEFLQFEAGRPFHLIVFCQALYMFPDIEAVVRRAAYLLRPGGVLVVACERVTREVTPLSPMWWRRRLRWAVRGRADDSGRYDYTDSEYRKAIQAAGLRYVYQRLPYPVKIGDRSLPAGNHFGVKG